jgi:hypothetical protein
VCLGAHGRHLEVVTVENDYGLAKDLVHEALQQGALPSLKVVSASLEFATHRASLTQGFLRAMHELRVTIAPYHNNTSEIEAQVAALGLVRQLPALAKLEVSVLGRGAKPVQWPAFISPSLKVLHIDVGETGALSLSLLGALPGILGASGATLDRLEVVVPADVLDLGDGLVHVAQALRSCLSTLKGLLLMTSDSVRIHVDSDANDFASQAERLRVQWADVLAGVSCCHELEVLVLPCITVKTLFPPGCAFRRLTHLEISDYDGEDAPTTGWQGLWEVMASGGLPALAKFSATFKGRWGAAEKMKTQVAPALEAVAATLTELSLESSEDGEWLDDEAAVGYELGAAVGKLRRLNDLALDLFRDGRAYHAVAQVRVGPFRDSEHYT